MHLNLTGKHQTAGDRAATVKGGSFCRQEDDRGHEQESL